MHLRNAQEECGEEAIVISTKKISSASDGNKDMYEVVVTIEDEEQEMKHTKKIVSQPTMSEPRVEAKFMILKKKFLKCKMQFYKSKNIMGP